jgi:tetratricopeptide (TPR) repeat protein
MRSLCLWIVLSCGAFGQSSAVFQQTNPNYPIRNPFYFEGKITWDKLGITTPSNAWEFMQRGIHLQDDLEDLDGAKADYVRALASNSMENGTCQILRTVPATDFGKLDPAPCMFTVRLRLGYLLMKQDPAEAIRLFEEVLKIDRLRLDVNQLIGETWVLRAEKAVNDSDRTSAYVNAIAAFKKELALSPVTLQTQALTGDQANNVHTHWALADVYEKLERFQDAKAELGEYLKATKWHSDIYPWRIQLARKRIERLRSLQSE